MICSNQQMIAQVFCFLEDEPPVLVDWLPWHHTFAGNHDIGVTLYNGGTYYVDEGKPAPGLIEETVRNLREISTTIFLNVPKGYEASGPIESSARHFFAASAFSSMPPLECRSLSGMPTASLLLKHAANEL
jgi:acyl-CoA synthetase (AMP-forming)/AMP-acid ligase II